MFKTLLKLREAFDYSRASVQTDLKKYLNLLEKINRIYDEELSDAALKQAVAKLKYRALEGITLDNLRVEAFALIREIVRRTMGLHPFDVQVIAGIALDNGKIIEMQTGEGKTLAAVFPAFLNALTGKGVHILTFNDYLAKRDAQWMKPVYQFCGLSVGYIQNEMTPEERKQAYACDITYVTAKEAGFDFLRSFLADDPDGITQRPLAYAIVDEADSILIDEGRSPLVIAGKSPLEAVNAFQSYTEIVREFRLGIDYEVDQNRRNVYLAEAGMNQAERRLGCGNLYLSENSTSLTLLNHALHAHVLLQRDIDYIVKQGRVMLVDEFTGRVVENRHWPDGLQEAVEAKEGLANQGGGRILGSITMGSFLNNYPKVCGMTGTAQVSANDFKELYNLEVIVIPQNRPCIRIDHPDMIFGDQASKFEAIMAEVLTVHQSGRPILIGTGSIQESEKLAVMLDEKQLPYQLLNAKNDESEAKLVAEAGALGAVTISTNMAGRGTDIRLGGAEQRDFQKVVELGGLYVIGTNRFESSRIDNQLRGRAGRQGDPGSSRFFISLDDDLMVRYGIKEILASNGDALINSPINDPQVNCRINHIQKQIENQNFEVRRHLWKYSWVVEKYREQVQNRRQRILHETEDLTLWETVFPERYRELSEKVGQAVLKKAEKQITLFQMDKLWAEFLEDVTEIKEGIHLVRFGKKVPLDEFHRLVREAYLEFEDRLEREIAVALAQVEIGEDRVNLERVDLKGPAATWTYLVNDTPFERKMIFDWMEGLRRGLRKG